MKRLKNVPTLGKQKKREKATRFERFHLDEFFNDKKLRLVEVLNLDPLKLLVSIEEDKTTYQPFKDGNIPNNTDRLFQVTLSGKHGTKPGGILVNGEAYVTFDYQGAEVAIVSHSQLYVKSRKIVLTSIEQDNLQEFYQTKE